MACFLAKLNALSAVHGDRIAYLTSLKEATVTSSSKVLAMTATNGVQADARVPLHVEPSFLALG